MQRNLWNTLADYPELHIGQYLVPNFASNSVAIEVNPHCYTLISPGLPLLDDWVERMASSGVPDLHLVMPNAYHYLGIPGWLAAFPKARLYASQKAIKRLKGKGLKNITALEDECPPLPTQVTCLIPPGHRGGDVWLRMSSPKGTLWIVCDTFQTYMRLSNQPIARVLQRIMGTAPGLKMSQVVKWGLLDNRRAFKTWLLDQLSSDQPTGLIPSHGEPLFNASLTEDLRHLVQSRL